MRERRVFLIGPGGVGKTTVGPLVAAMLGAPFVDLDAEFTRRIESVGTFLPREGYQRYVTENAAVFEQLITETLPPFVMALSSGFLSIDGGEVALRNRARVRELGRCILLLPDTDKARATEIIVQRQLGRGFGLQEQRERERFTRRFDEYLPLANAVVFSCEAPVSIAAAVCAKLEIG